MKLRAFEGYLTLCHASNVRLYSVAGIESPIANVMSEKIIKEHRGTHAQIAIRRSGGSRL